MRIAFYLHFLMTSCFPFWEFKSCPGGRGWKASYAGWYGIVGPEVRGGCTGSLGQSLSEVWISIYVVWTGCHPEHLWLLSLARAYSEDLTEIHFSGAFTSSPSAPFGDAHNNQLSGPSGSSSNLLFHTVSPPTLTFFPTSVSQPFELQADIENDICMAPWGESEEN